MPIGTSASLDYNNLDPHDTQLSSILSNNTSTEKQRVSSLNFHRNQDQKLDNGLFIPGQQLKDIVATTHKILATIQPKSNNHRFENKTNYQNNDAYDIKAL